MWPFKRKQESPQEIAAEKKLDEVTREVGWDEFDKEAGREAPLGPLEPLGLIGAIQGPLEGDPDPGDEHGLRDALREGAEDRREELGAARPEPPPQ
jgi:hypothetical protein